VLDTPAARLALAVPENVTPSQEFLRWCRTLSNEQLLVEANRRLVALGLPPVRGAA
jgi:hypothetical protein